MSFLMTKVGLNMFFSINQSVSHHNIMVLLPYVSQLSNVTSQLKDIYGLHVGVQLVMRTGVDMMQGFQSGPVPGTFTRLKLCIVQAEITEPPKISGGLNHKYDRLVEYFS